MKRLNRRLTKLCYICNRFLEASQIAKRLSCQAAWIFQMVGQNDWCFAAGWKGDGGESVELTADETMLHL